MEDPNRNLTQQEILALTPPTYGQLLQAYDIAIKANPALVNNETELLQVMVKWIKARPNGELSSVKGSSKESGINVQASVVSTLIELTRRLTPAEWEVFSRNVYKTIQSLNTAKDAEKGAVASFPCDDKFDDTKLNAILHSYWNALMTKRSGAKFAKEFSTAHESLSSKDAHNTKMDLHNNQIGISIAEKYPDATEEQLLDLLIHQKFTYVLPLDDFPKNVDGLIFITDKRPYDGTMTGTMTNPDSNTTWNATFDFNQCGNTIRGQITVVSGNASQKRRFTGVITSGGALSLNVSDPYVFENPNNLAYCTNMIVSLSGNDLTLSGNWKSSNCKLGGNLWLNK